MKFGNLRILSDPKIDVLQTVYRTVLTSAQTSITISGLNGNLDQNYLLDLYIFGNNAGGGDINLRFNGDSGTNYSAQYLNANNTTLSGSSQISQDNIHLTKALNAEYAIARAQIISTLLVPRTVIIESGRQISGQTVTEYEFRSGAWNNNSDNIISITIYSPSASAIGINTFIHLMRKIKK
jgi:hypothetical protein